MTDSIAPAKKPSHLTQSGSIKVEPIRDKKAIERIKKLLRDNPRDLCLFVLGINTAYHVKELLLLKVGHVRHLRPGDRLTRKQSKTQTYGMILNHAAHAAIQTWLTSEKGQELTDEDFLFTGKLGVLKVSTVSSLVKTWCKNVGLTGHHGRNTMRKTWGYWQYKEHGIAIPLLMEALCHFNQRQTLEYLCLKTDEIAQIDDLAL
jgi:integrase